MRTTAIAPITAALLAGCASTPDGTSSNSNGTSIVDEGQANAALQSYRLLGCAAGQAYVDTGAMPYRCATFMDGDELNGDAALTGAITCRIKSTPFVFKTTAEEMRGACPVFASPIDFRAEYALEPGTLQPGAVQIAEFSSVEALANDE